MKYYEIPENVAETNHTKGYFRRVYEIRHDLGPNGTYKAAWEQVEKERAFYGYQQRYTYGTFRRKITEVRFTGLNGGLKFV